MLLKIRKKHFLVKSLITLTLFAVIAIGCDLSLRTSYALSPCEDNSPVRGKVLRIDAIHTDGGVQRGEILLDSSQEMRSPFDKVSVLIHGSTQVFEKRGRVCRVIPLSSLSTGYKVQVRVTDVTSRSSPPRVDVSNIVVLASEK